MNVLPKKRATISLPKEEGRSGNLNMAETEVEKTGKRRLKCLPSYI